MYVPNSLLLRGTCTRRFAQNFHIIVDPSLSWVVNIVMRGGREVMQGTCEQAGCPFNGASWGMYQDDTNDEQQNLGMSSMRLEDRFGVAKWLDTPQHQVCTTWGRQMQFIQQLWTRLCYLWYSVTRHYSATHLSREWLSSSSACLPQTAGRSVFQGSLASKNSENI